MANSSTLRKFMTGLIALAVLGVAAHAYAYSVMPSADRVSAQDGGTATPAATAGELVVVPGVVEMGKTVLAVGFHVAPVDLEVAIRYSGHFTPEGESCDNAGTAGATQAAVAPTWVTLNACTAGDGYVRMVESATGNVIKDVSVTVIEPGVTGEQARVSVTISGLAPAELVPRGSGDPFSVRATGLQAHREYNLHTVVLNSLSAAFNRGCTTFKVSDSIVGQTSTTGNYTVYGCVAPSALIWSWVEDSGGRSLASSGVLNNEVDIADPKVFFEKSSYSVNEGDKVDVTVKLSHPSNNPIRRVPIKASLGTGGSVTFNNHSISENFPYTPPSDPDCENETAILSFGTPPSTVSVPSPPPRATITILDDDACASFGSDSYSVDEGSHTAVTVNLSRASSQDLEIPITVTSGRAESTDYVVRDLTNGKLLIPDGERSAMFTIHAEQDVDRDDETVNLRFGTLPSGVVKGTRTSATVTILDDEDVSVSFEHTSYTVREGESIGIDVELNGRRSQEIEIPIDVDSDDADSDDYSVAGLTNGKLTFSAWHNSETFWIDTEEDDVIDDHETVDLGFGALPSGVRKGTPSSATVTIDEPNVPPTFREVEPATRLIAENTAPDTNIGSPVRASDDDGDALTYSLLGTDSDAFTIVDNTGQIRTSASLNYESKNSYSVIVKADDGKGGTDSIKVTINVTNLRPTITSGSDSPSYGEGGRGSVEDYDATDPGGGDISWSVSGTDADAFSIFSSGALRFVSLPDFENPDDDDEGNNYEITVTASDGELTASRDVTVEVTNLAPTITSGSDMPKYAENRTDAVEDYDASDPGGGDIFWSLPVTTHATDRADFEITEDGELTFKSSPDFESPHDSDPDNEYKVTVRASDRSGTMADRNVTVTVTNVNEAPVGSAIADRILARGVASLRIDLSSFFSDPDGDTLAYTAASDDLGVATTSVRGSTLTLTAVSAGLATITVTAADRSVGDAERLTVSQGFTVTVDAQLPTITITRKFSAVDEGDPVVFTVWADPAPTSALRVNVRVTAEGSFLTGTRPSQVTISRGMHSEQFSLRTADDSIDEANGTVTATVRSGADYEVGSPSSAEVTVRDDADKPPIPTGLRANGDLDSNGNVTLRWNAVSGAISYEFRYAVETCRRYTVVVIVDGEEEERERARCENGNWSPTFPSTTTNAKLGGLSENTLYRVEVRTVIADESFWSDFALVFPTDSPLGRGTDVATAPFHGYQVKNAQGSHEFQYVLCEETIPMGLTMTARNMKDAVDEWENAVAWDRNGTNMISTVAHALPQNEKCHTGIALPRGRFEVKFVSDLDIRNACNPIPWETDGPPACWRSSSWERVGVGPIASGTVLLNADRGATHWNGTVAGGHCKKLHETIVHEIGHAFGIGNARWFNYNRHPVNDTLAVMSYANSGDYCQPQSYDIVALMALYQSR